MVMQTPNYDPYKYLRFKENGPYRRYIHEAVLKQPAPEASIKGSVLSQQSHGSYGALLFHPSWKAKRKEILDRDLHRCVHCRSDKQLQVHHRQYHFVERLQKFRLPWEYPGHLLITLCEACHNKGHHKYKVPTITV